MPLGPFFADFCSHGAQLIIELDGGQRAGTVERDVARTAFLNGEGYRALRFWNNDVIENVTGVLETINGHLPFPLAREGAPRGADEGD